MVFIIITAKKNGTNYLVREASGLGGFEHPIKVGDELLEQIESLCETNKLDYIEELYNSRLKNDGVKSKTHAVIDSDFIKDMAQHMIDNASFTLNYDEEMKPYLSDHDNWSFALEDFLNARLSLNKILESVLIKKMIDEKRLGFKYEVVLEEDFTHKLIRQQVKTLAEARKAFVDDRNSKNWGASDYVHRETGDIYEISTNKIVAFIAYNGKVFENSSPYNPEKLTEIFVDNVDEEDSSMTSDNGLCR